MCRRPSGSPRTDPRFPYTPLFRSADTGKLSVTAGGLLEVLRPRGVPLLVNDRVDVALAVGAEGVHLGQSDMPPAIARRLLGEDAVIGLSITRAEELRKADPAVVDRSEERRVGKECVSTCRSRWWPYHYNKK